MDPEKVEEVTEMVAQDLRHKFLKFITSGVNEIQRYDDN
jgi:hypothetical protein